MIVKRQNKKKIMMTLKKIESTKLDEKRAKKKNSLRQRDRHLT